MEVKDLIRDLRADVPVDVTDETLIELATFAAVELRRRLPIYAIRQGDLPEEYEAAARLRAQISYELEDCMEGGLLFGENPERDGK